MNIYYDSQNRAIADPTLQRTKEASCRRRAIYPTVELAILVIFFYIVPIHRFFFLILYCFSRHTRTYCNNPGPPKEFGPPKVKFFIYCLILMKFEMQPFHMLTNNSWDKNLWIRAPSLSAPLGTPRKNFAPPKVKFFIYCSTLMKFDI